MGPLAPVSLNAQVVPSASRTFLEFIRAYGSLLDQVGISPISFGVHDVKALAAELTAKGYELAGPAESFLNASGEMRGIYLFDPDGILVQFNNPDVGG